MTLNANISHRPLIKSMKAIPEAADDLYPITGLAGVHQVVVEQDVTEAGQLAGRCLLRHFLNCPIIRLPVLVCFLGF